MLSYAEYKHLLHFGMYIVLLNVMYVTSSLVIVASTLKVRHMLRNSELVALLKLCLVFMCVSVSLCSFVCLVWCFISQSTAMVMLGQSVHLTTLFSSASLTKR